MLCNRAEAFGLAVNSHFLRAKTVTQEQLQHSVNFLLSLSIGISNTRWEGSHDYAEGFALGVQMWETADDPQTSFRRIVDAKQNGILDGESEEMKRGYNDALRVFQEAKSLSTGST